MYIRTNLDAIRTTHVDRADWAETLLYCHRAQTEAPTPLTYKLSEVAASPAAAPPYLPRVASELALQRARKAACAAATFSFLPAHFLMVLCCSARPKEKVSVHGFSTSSLFIAFRFCDASSSLCPPERNTTPGTAGGTVRRSAATVYSAITSAPTYTTP
uniref:Uncharacterized protein n=1 Tax=Leersia perrieri TaxID=77586 RepID=A0A0D9WS08_9ORYZ